MRFAVARRQGLTEETLALVDDYEHSSLGAREKAILRFVDAFVQAPEAVPDELRRELLVHLDPPQLVELTVAVAAFFGFSKLRIALGLVPDGMEVRVVQTPDVTDDRSSP